MKIEDLFANIRDKLSATLQILLPSSDLCARLPAIANLSAEVLTKVEGEGGHHSITS
ncbi:MAG: hypothetical protein H7246_18195 [Phycisphaerae bacterium]|nr:hypothetical protein [Saprospiraceae bacterium]